MYVKQEQKQSMYIFAEQQLQMQLQSRKNRKNNNQKQKQEQLKNMKLQKYYQTWNIKSSWKKNIFWHSVANLSNKYFINFDIKDMKQYYNLIIEMVNQAKYRIEQAAAAIIYFIYSQQMRLDSIKTFIKMNQLNHKAFLKYYKIFYNMKKNNIKFIQVKEQQTQQQNTIKKQQNNNFSIKQQYVKQQQKINYIECVSHVYDMIFKKSYYQEKRREIVQKLVRKLEQYQFLTQRMNWEETQLAKIYYVLYYIIKECRNSDFLFKQYAAKIKTKSGIQLSKENCLKSQKIWKQELKTQDPIQKQSRK